MVRNIINSKKRVKTIQSAVAARGLTTYTIPAIAISSYNSLSQTKTLLIIKVKDIIKMFKDLFINYTTKI